MKWFKLAVEELECRLALAPILGRHAAAVPPAPVTATRYFTLARTGYPFGLDYPAGPLTTPPAGYEYLFFTATTPPGGALLPVPPFPYGYAVPPSAPLTGPVAGGGGVGGGKGATTGYTPPSYAHLWGSAWFVADDSTTPNAFYRIYLWQQPVTPAAPQAHAGPGLGVGHHG